MEKLTMSDSSFRVEQHTEPYVFVPTLHNEGIIDYTGVQPNKIILANRKTILAEDFPSYLPPIHIRRHASYDIPAYKVTDNEYLLRESDVLHKNEQGNLQSPRIYRVSLDVYAALIQYHLEFDRAAFAAVAKRNEEERCNALNEANKEYKVVLERTIPELASRIDINALPATFTNRNISTENKPSRVSLRSTKSKRMNHEPYFFINERAIKQGKKLTKAQIFGMHRECIENVNQKILDMELQKADWESSWTKGRETAYGNGNLDESLYKEYGVRVKRQNGNSISKSEISELQMALDDVYTLYGNVTDVVRKYDLKISHAGNKRMHALKYVGLFSSYFNAIGISFASGQQEASLTAIHEYAHFLDHISGKEYNAWHASDIPGTLENTIAVQFRNHMNEAKGDYWKRTSECFARALEEYAHIKMLREQNGIDSISFESIKKINEKVSKAGSVSYLVFQNKIEPLVASLLVNYKERFVNEKKIQEYKKTEISYQANRDKVENLNITENSSSFKQLELFEPSLQYISKEYQFFDGVQFVLNAKENIFSEKLVLSNPSAQLIYAGLTEKKITLSCTILHNARLEGLSAHEISQTLRSATDPVIVFSDNSHGEERYVIVSDIISNKSPVALFIGTDWISKDFVIDCIRELDVKQELQYMANSGFVQYVDDKKLATLMNEKKTTFPLLNNRSFINAMINEQVKTKTGFLAANHYEITEDDPAITRNLIRQAKVAQRVYTNRVFKGHKSGLWKSFRDFKLHGVFDIQGAHVAVNKNGDITRDGWEQLYEALNIYRDKRFETFRVLFVTSEGTIKDQLAISSYMPNKVNLSLLTGELKDQVIKYALYTETRLVIAHNHPSGNITASSEDDALTRHLERILVDKKDKTLLQGHIILDHESFSFYESNNWHSIQNNTQLADPLMKTRLPVFTQEKLNSDYVLRDIAEQINESHRWNSKDWVPILFTDSNARISGIRYYSAEWVIKTLSENIINEFQKVGIQSGATRAFPIINHEMAQLDELKNAVIGHMKNGCFMDFCIDGKTAEMCLLNEYRSNIYQSLSNEAVLERTTLESTFVLKERKRSAQSTDKGVSIKNQRKYGGPGRGENLFHIDTSPRLSVALASISNADIGRPSARIIITENTPFIFSELGLPNKKIEIYVDKIARSILLPITERHGHSNSITKENVLDVCSKIANPRAVFRSKKTISLVAVYDVLDTKSEPIMISLKNENKIIEANLVTSIYGKPTRDIEFWIDSGSLMYVNDLEKEKAFMLPSRQLRMSNINAFNNSKILHKSEFVNSGFIQESEQEYATENGGIKMDEKEVGADNLLPKKLKEAVKMAINEEKGQYSNSAGHLDEGADKQQHLVKENLAEITKMAAKEQATDQPIVKWRYPHHTKYPKSEVNYVDTLYKTLGIDPHAIEPKISYNQLHTEKILESVKTKFAPFLGLPSETGTVTLEPLAIRSAETGRAFRGMNQILAQIMTQEAGGKDKELITYEQTKRHGAGIKKGSIGINLTTFDAATSNQKVYRYYPKSAVYHQEKLPTIPERKQNKDIVVHCDESQPEKYLGYYLAATSLGARFETPETVMFAFQKNLSEDLTQSYKEKKFTKIYEIGNKASVICQKVMSEIGAKAREKENIREKAFEIKSRYEPYNPVTGEKFVGQSAKKATYVMQSRQSLDPRFLELTDIMKAGLSLKDTVKEPLIISEKGKSRFFYNAKDIEGIPQMKIKTINLAQQQKTTNKEIEL